MSVDNNPKEEELCLVDSCTTNSILKETKYFQTPEKREGNIMTIASQDVLIVGSGLSYYYSPYGYTDNDGGCFVVSRFDSYPSKL